MQASLVPRIAWPRLKPSSASQPLPGSRLLQRQRVSRKYVQRVRCSRLPPTVAALRICPDAPLSSASDTAGKFSAIERIVRDVAVARERTDAHHVAAPLDRMSAASARCRRRAAVAPRRSSSGRSASCRRRRSARRRPRAPACAPRPAIPRRRTRTRASACRLRRGRSRRRCSGRRRSGRDCRSSLRGSRLRRARGLRRSPRPPRGSARACRSRTGTRRARRTRPARRASASPSARPSIVVTSSPACGKRERQARQRPAPVDQHGARAALTAVAAFLRAGQAGAVAQQVEQRNLRFDRERRLAAVQLQGERDDGAGRSERRVGSSHGDSSWESEPVDGETRHVALTIHPAA